jgi:hypothetical protein
MKKSILSNCHAGFFLRSILFSAAIIGSNSEIFAQNAFPTTGNVGIGTPSPAYNLQVVSPDIRAIQIDGNNTAWTGFYVNNTTTTGQPFMGLISNNGANTSYQYLTPAGDLRTYLNGDLLTLTKTGHVGIGTTSPQYKFHINSPDIRAFQIDGNNAAWTGFYVNNTTTTGQPFVGWISNNGANTAYQYLTPAGDLRTFVNGDVMTLSKTGRVGLGTTSPTYKLHINSPDTRAIQIDGSNASWTGFYVNNTTTTGQPFIGLISNNGANTSYQYLTPTGDLRTFVNGDVMTLSRVGRVGIGTTSPSYKLHINSPDVRAIQIDGSNASWTGFYVNNTTTTGQPFVGLISNNGANTSYQYLTPTGDWRLFVGGDRMVVTKSGNVGIGTLTPSSSYALSVNGSIRAKELVVESGWADFVFEKDYELKSLSELESFIAQNKHLPGVPSATEVKAEGVKIGEFQTTLLQKIEELTLYMIELQKQNDKLAKEVANLKK